MFDEARLEILLDAYFDQILTASERAELEQVLLSSGRARAIFWERAGHHATIRQWGMQEWGRKMAAELPEAAPAPVAVMEALEPELDEPRPNSWQIRLAWSFAMAACLAVAFLLWHAPRSNIGSAFDETPDQGVAVLTRTAGVSWNNADAEIVPGTPLQPGWLRLKEGLIHIEFYSGARLIVEGPAELELISSTEAFCKYGKVNAYVPEQAQGFKVRSPEVDVVDLGTSFGINVPPDGPSEVHVFGGEVELTRVGERSVSQKLTGGEAVRVNRIGQVREIPSAPSDFITLPELQRRETIELGRRLADWRASNQSVGADPAALVFYTFDGEPNGDRRVKNQADNPVPSTEGSIVSCDWVEGRWPGKMALEFKRRSDRVRLGIPGSHKSLTCIAWVRIDSLPRPFNALLMSDDLGVGEVRWDVTRNGELRFGLRVASNVWERAVSPAIITPDRFGQWLHLATVVDTEARVIRHYVNGQPVSTSRPPKTVLMRLGNCELGNWGVRADNPHLLRKDDDYITRPFNGRIDEFTVSSRAFTEQEIRERYEVGKPVSGIPALAQLVAPQ